MGQVEIERRTGMTLDKIASLLCIGPGGIVLVGTKLNHFVALDIDSAMHIIAIGDAEILIEPALQGQEFFAVTQVPFPHDCGGISPGFQKIGCGNLLQWHPGKRAWKKDTVDPHTLWDPSGKQGSPGGGADRGGGIELCKFHSPGSHLIDVWSPDHLIPKTPQVAISQVVAINHYDVGT